MRFRAEEAVRTLSVHSRAEEQSQHTAHLVVKFPCGVLAALDIFKIWCGKIIVLVSVACACRQTIGPGSELHVQSVLYSLVSVVTSAPVAYHHAVKCPVALQNAV